MNWHNIFHWFTAVWTKIEQWTAKDGSVMVRWKCDICGKEQVIDIYRGIGAWGI